MSELERSLVESWSLDTLAVYADHLQRQGDPRGELMALDLSPTPEDEGWKHQRQALLVAWLGEELAARAGHLVQHGYLHAARQDRFHPPDLLDGPLGALVRSYTLRGDEQALARFASRPRPWLTRLTLGNGGSAPFSDTVRDALIASAPHLQELLLMGRPAFDAFMHPGVRRLYVERSPRHRQRHTVAVPRGVEVRELYPSGDARGPSVQREEVDLALDAVDETPDLGQLESRYGALFTDGDSLPALLLRLRSAGLVALDGPIARLTAAGRVLRNKEAHHPPRVRALEVDSLKWVLWADTGRRREREVYILGILAWHAQLIDRCLALVPLSKEVQDTLVAWRHFLGEVLIADDDERLQFGALGPLAQAVETLLELWDLLERDVFWEGVEPSMLRNLEEAIGLTQAPRKLRFYVVWGM